jgi:hypothetical protein
MLYHVDTQFLKVGGRVIQKRHNSCNTVPISLSRLASLKVMKCGLCLQAHVTKMVRTPKLNKPARHIVCENFIFKTGIIKTRNLLANLIFCY